MKIYLAQHGAAVDAETDPQRPLSEPGRAQVTKSAQLLKREGVELAGIRHSGKLRALQTAQLFAETLGVSDVDRIDGMDPNDDPAAFAHRITAGDLLYAGHLPHLQRVVSQLVTGDPERKILQFHNGGVVCLERGEGGSVILWYTP